HEVCGRLQRLKPHIAPAWVPEQITVLVDAWNRCLPDFVDSRKILERIRAEQQKTWRDGLITAAELQTKQFAPVRIVVPGLIPEGVTIVAGKPKIGKSFLALDVCIAVAGDRFVLGEIKPVQGDALYLALEDNERRLKKRI